MFKYIDETLECVCGAKDRVICNELPYKPKICIYNNFVTIILLT